jgi:hypothetical protein
MKATIEPQVSWRLVTALSIVIGFFAFLMVVGPRALQPSNIAWLEYGDPVTHYLGWQFFRNSDWSFPIGLNPKYGLEISNAVIFSDSNPLLAVLFKPFSKFLPDTFQYFGIWLLACFVLQAWLASKLMGLITTSPIIALLGACFFSFAPPMIWRLQGHLSLVGHFFVLASLYLALSPSPNRRIVRWAVLLVACALTHAYLLAMVGVVWGADIVGRLIKKSLSFGRVTLEFPIILFATFLACWQAGYFSVSDGFVANGFGFFRMNLLSVFDPDGWSYLLRDIPQAAGDYEGFNYLGLGVIFLGIYALPHLFSAQAGVVNEVLNRPVLLAAMLVLTVFALSNNLGIASVNFDFSIPDSVLRVANIFRASGRMFWPVFYLMLFTIIFLVVRGYSKRVAIIILGLGLIIQIADTSTAWTGIREKLMTTPSSTWRTKMADPFWKEAAAQYSKVRLLIPGNHTANWQAVASYAGIHGLATDSVYLARASMAAVEASQQTARTTLLSGEFQSDSLYFLEHRLLPQVARSLNVQSDLLAQIDGFIIVAPGWKKCATCTMVSGEITISDFLPVRLRLGERLVFSKNQLGSRSLHAGWTDQEELGVWSGGSDATIVLSIETERATTIIVEALPLLSPSHTKQTVEVKINGIATNSVTLTANSGSAFKIIIPELVRKQLPENDGLLKVELHFPNAARPVDIGVNVDERRLAIFLISLSVQ